MRDGYRWFFRAVLLYALLAGVIGNLAMLPRIGRPWGGFITQWQQHDQASLIIPGNSPSAPGLLSGALRRGDVIREVAGVDLRTQTLPEAYEALYATGQRTVQYVVQRDGQQITAEGPLQLFALNDLLEYRVLYVALALAVWLLGWIVLNAAPQIAANRAFALFCASVVILILPGTSYFNNGRNDVLGVALTMLTAIAFTPLASAALLHFALSFPTELSPRWTRLVYLPALAIIALHEYTSAHMFNSTPALIAGARVATTFNVVSAALALAVLLARCIHGLRREQASVRERHQITLVLLGFTCGVLLPGLPYAAYVLAAGAYTPASALDRPLIAFLFPAFIGYAILRYQMFRGRSRALFTLIMLALGATLAQLAIIFLAGPGARGAPGQNMIIAGVVAASLLTSLFWQSDGRLPRLINRMLRRDEARYQALSNLIRATGRVSWLPDLARRITEQLMQDFEADYVALWLYDPARGWAACHTCYRTVEAPLDASAVEGLLATSDGIRLAPDPRRQEHAPGPETTAPPAVVVPLYASTTAPASRLGALVIGPPWTGNIYDERDLQLFAVLAEQVAAALVIAQQVDHLKQEPQRILAEVERERERIARELHDTVQQEMGALPYLLEAIQAEVRNPAKVQPLFDECYDKVGRVSLELHNLRHDISPPELWSGDYEPALRGLMYRKLTAQGLACSINWSASCVLDRARATALYRICQQAFDNIVQHAHASSVGVTALSPAEQQLCIRIEDNGHGFDIAQLSILAQEGHAGIVSMRQRAESLGGKFHIESRPGNGTVIEVKLPLGVAARPSHV